MKPKRCSPGRPAALIAKQLKNPLDAEDVVFSSEGIYLDSDLIIRCLADDGPIILMWVAGICLEMDQFFGGRLALVEMTILR